MNPNEPRQPGLDLGGKQLCRSCTTPNAPGAHFCVKCGAPLSSYSTMGPYETVFAQGFVYRQAAERPQRLIVVLGIWLIFLPTAIGGLLLLGSTSALYYDLFGGFAIFISIGMIGRTTWNYLSNKRANNQLQIQQDKEA